jgi:hypothetical protein
MDSNSTSSAFILLLASLRLPCHWCAGVKNLAANHTLIIIEIPYIKPFSRRYSQRLLTSFNFAVVASQIMKLTFWRENRRADVLGAVSDYQQVVLAVDLLHVPCSGTTACERSCTFAVGVVNMFSSGIGLHLYFSHIKLLGDANNFL